MEGLADNAWSITARDDFDFSFAFNNCSFSDRILRLEITMELQQPKLGAEDDGAPRSMIQNAVNMTQESSSDVIMSESADNLNAIIEVRAIHINSLLLAKKSQYFFKLFSNGMRETMKKEVTVQITFSEEHAFMDLLNFMYCGTLKEKSTKELLDVMILADRFEVLSCASALLGQPMSNQLASLVLSLPCGLLGTDAMQPLSKAAKEQLLNHFSDDGQCEYEYMNLPINVIEELLSSDELTVSSEDYIFDFVMKWAKQRYNEDDERRKVLRTKLVKLIRFPHMSNSKLSQIPSHKDLHCANVFKRLSEALLFKAGNSGLSFNSTEERFRKRCYELITVRVVEIHTPLIDSKKCWHCDTLSTKFKVCVYCEFDAQKSQRSEAFHMLGKEFSLVSLSTWSDEDEYWMWELFVETMDDGEFSLQCQGSFRAGKWQVTYDISTLDFGRGKKLIGFNEIHVDGDHDSHDLYGNILYLKLSINEVTGK